MTGARPDTTLTPDQTADGMTSLAARREPVTTRVIDAPRELVFRAWTDPDNLTRWWGPRGFTTPVCEMDVRPGGTYRIVMRGPDGVEYPGKGTYREVVPPDRLVYTDTFDLPDGEVCPRWAKCSSP